MSLVKALNSAGIHVEVRNGSRLLVGPSERINQDIRALVVQFKWRIIEELRQESARLLATPSSGRIYLPHDIEESVQRGDYSLLPQWCVPTSQELAEYSGTHWTTIRTNPKLLHAWKYMLIEMRLIERDVVPPWFNLIGQCQRCGEVPLPPGTEGGELERCPWCSSCSNESLLSSEAKT